MSDFGLAKIGSRQDQRPDFNMQAGATGYLAPELVYHYLLQISFKAIHDKMYFYSTMEKLQQAKRPLTQAFISSSSYWRFEKS